MPSISLIVSYIVLFLFGTLIGNFTTTIFHRLPRNIMISGFDQKVTRPPFCSNCGHILRFYEYLPILSWFSTFGKCWATSNDFILYTWPKFRVFLYLFLFRYTSYFKYLYIFKAQYCPSKDYFKYHYIRYDLSYLNRPGDYTVVNKLFFGCYYKLVDYSQ